LAPELLVRVADERRKIRAFGVRASCSREASHFRNFPEGGLEPLVTFLEPGVDFMESILNLIHGYNFKRMHEQITNIEI
jgi:hypothetical protein